MEMNSSKGAWAGGIGQEAGMGCTPKKELDFLRALLHILSYLGDGGDANSLTSMSEKLRDTLMSKAQGLTRCGQTSKLQAPPKTSVFSMTNLHQVQARTPD